MLGEQHRSCLTKFAKIGPILGLIPEDSIVEGKIRICPEEPILSGEKFSRLLDEVIDPIRLEQLKIDFKIPHFNGKHKKIIFKSILDDGASVAGAKANLQFEDFDALGLFLSQRPLDAGNFSRLNIEAVKDSARSTLVQYYAPGSEATMLVQHVRITVTRFDVLIMSTISSNGLFHLRTVFDFVLLHLVIRGLQKQFYKFSILKLINVAGRADLLFKATKDFFQEFAGDLDVRLHDIITDALAIQYVDRRAQVESEFLRKRVAENASNALDWSDRMFTQEEDDAAKREMLVKRQKKAEQGKAEQSKPDESKTEQSKSSADLKV